jgi:hypothetical protein
MLVRLIPSTIFHQNIRIFKRAAKSSVASRGALVLEPRIGPAPFQRNFLDALRTGLTEVTLKSAAQSEWTVQNHSSLLLVY